MSKVDDNFSFFIPVIADLQKSEDSSEPEMRIRGYASTPDRDRQEDLIIQQGLDISDFVNYGWFNYDHNSDDILGYPDAEKTKIDRNGFYVEGCLLPSVPLAKKMWDVAVSLQKDNAPRKLGFSVEGKTLERDELGRITKAKIYNVAITPNPVNPKATWEALVKSFTTSNTSKAMEAGYDTAIGEVNNGSSLKREDLEQAFKILAKALGGDDDASKCLDVIHQKLGLQKSIDSDELILYFQLSKGLTRQDAVELVKNLMKS